MTHDFVLQHMHTWADPDLGGEVHSRVGRVGISGWDRIGDTQAASGITHLLASTFVRGHAFNVIRTPSIPSGSPISIAIADRSGIRREEKLSSVR